LISKQDYKRILSNWDILFLSEEKNLVLYGSPQRSSFRTVIKDTNYNLYVLEELHASKIEEKKRIAQTLSYLSKNMQTINPYILSRKGDEIVHDNSYWQLSRYIQGESLHRPGYINDKWRGKAIADFIITMRRNIINTGFLVFHLDIYIDHLIRQTKRYQPDIFERLLPYAIYLRSLFSQKMKTAVCHGDLHPMNIIWGKDKILAVIDWEFIGIKPEIYDLANLIGCVGFEDPHALDGPLVTELKNALSSEFSKESWLNLPYMILATRFGWMSEWLKNKDKEMQEMELAYMEILIKKNKKIKHL
jgi:homoserine kinase type II